MYVCMYVCMYVSFLFRTKKGFGQKRILGLASDSVILLYKLVRARARVRASQVIKGKVRGQKKDSGDGTFCIISFTNGPQAGGRALTPFGPEFMVFARFYKGFGHFATIFGWPAGRPGRAGPRAGPEMARMFFLYADLADFPSSDLHSSFWTTASEIFCPDKK